MTLPKGKPKNKNRKLRAVLALTFAALGAKYLPIDGAEYFWGTLDDVPKDSHAQKLQSLPLCSKHPEYTNIICDESLGFLSDFPDMCPISNFHVSDPLSGAIQNRGNIDFCPQQSWGMPFDIYDSDQLFSFGRQQACETKALIAALECYDLEAAVSHLNNIANVDGVIINGESLLHYASRNGLQNIVEILLNKGYHFDEPNSNGDTPLMLAIDNNHLRLAVLLLPKMDNVDQRNVDGNTALHLAAQSDLVNIIQLLLRKTRRISIPNMDGKTPLMLAREYGQLAAKKCLLDAMYSDQDDDGITALRRAAIDGRLDDIMKLLDETDLINEPNTWGLTPAMEAINKGHVQIAEMILDRVNYVDQKDHNGNTALHLASKMGQLTIVKQLLPKSKLIHEPNDNRPTPLILALQYNNFDVAAILANEMVDVDQVDVMGNTALHYASFEGQIDVVKIILGKTRCIDKQNDAGFTPLMLAEKYGHNDVADMIQCFRDCNKQNNDGATPLILAILYQNFKVAAMLAEMVDVDQVDMRGNTALHYASFEGQVDVVKTILGKTRCIDKQNDAGFTPLMLAEKYGHNDVADMIRALRDRAN